MKYYYKMGSFSPVQNLKRRFSLFNRIFFLQTAIFSSVFPISTSFWRNQPQQRPPTTRCVQRWTNRIRNVCPLCTPPSTRWVSTGKIEKSSRFSAFLKHRFGEEEQRNLEWMPNTHFFFGSFCSCNQHFSGFSQCFLQGKKGHSLTSNFSCSFLTIRFHGQVQALFWEDSAQMVQLLLMHNANVNAQDQVAPRVDKSSQVGAKWRNQTAEQSAFFWSLSEGIWRPRAGKTSGTTVC